MYSHEEHVCTRQGMHVSSRSSVGLVAIYRNAVWMFIQLPSSVWNVRRALFSPTLHAFLLGAAGQIYLLPITRPWPYRYHWREPNVGLCQPGLGSILKCMIAGLGRILNCTMAGSFRAMKHTSSSRLPAFLNSCTGLSSQLPMWHRILWGFPCGTCQVRSSNRSVKESVFSRGALVKWEAEFGPRLA